MANPLNILVFPCGSEVALEIHRSLENSIHFNLIGANSIDDHGRFVFENYVDGVPFANHVDFIPSIKRIIIEKEIDVIFPAMDSVISTLKLNEKELGCPVIASDSLTTEICLSKSKTYSVLKHAIQTPYIYKQASEVAEFPVFLKPDIGYGSRGVKKVNSTKELLTHLENTPNTIILEYLPGNEYTVDCFSNNRQELLFVGPRQRSRISNGISVNTSTMPLENRFEKMAKAINANIKFNGAWFFQVKERADGTLVLMEVASRLGGSSSAYRAKGINFASLSIFNALGKQVVVIENNYHVELDRALNTIYKFDIEFNHAYIDFDDTLIVNNKVNTKLISLIYKFLNQRKKIYLITKHEYNIAESLAKYRLTGLFEKIIHLEKNDEKWKFIIHEDSIFIDDSFAERKQVKDNLGLAVFSMDMISML
jgi:predicted ATP-grasp superfamily ATP-dependent carboligase